MVDTDQVLHAYSKDCCCARCDTWSQAHEAVTRCFGDHRNDAATVSRALGAMLDAAKSAALGGAAASRYEQGFLDACWAFRCFIDNVPADASLIEVDGLISTDAMREIRELFEAIEAMRKQDGHAG